MPVPPNSGTGGRRVGATPSRGWSSRFGSADPDSIVGHDDEGAVELVEHVFGEKASQHVERDVRALIGEPQQHDAVMGAGLVDADVAEADIECQQQPPVRPARLDDD